MLAGKKWASGEFPLEFPLRMEIVVGGKKKGIYRGNPSAYWNEQFSFFFFFVGQGHHGAEGKGNEKNILPPRVRKSGSNEVEVNK